MTEIAGFDQYTSHGTTMQYRGKHINLKGDFLPNFRLVLRGKVI